MADPPELTPGTVYRWETLGEAFGFQPEYLGAVGGMVSRPDHNSLLLMTHPGGSRSIDYGDYWDGDDLIYTGRGKYGDQQRTGQNRDLGDNRRAVFVFEPAGSRQLLFRGRAVCVGEWTERDRDARGDDRMVLRFRLQFQEEPPRTDSRVQAPPSGRDPGRTPRPFDPNHAPREGVLGEPARTPEEAHALREKAVQGHHQLLVALSSWLAEQDWKEVAEIPLAIDLWARTPDGNSRVIFEAKTVRDASEGPRIRSAIAQLLEYRFFYGEPEDQLCIVCDRPISDRRVRLLDGLGIAVLWYDGETLAPGSGTASRVLEAGAVAAS